MNTCILSGVGRTCGVLGSALLLLFPLNMIRAADWLHVVRIEEDWELHVGEPDPDSVAPQVSCVISPVGNVNSLHAVFEINHQSLPSFTAGGLQLQIWRGEEPVASRKYNAAGVLANQDEVIRWTQVLTLHGNELTFEIRNGHSATWGEFGSEGTLEYTTASSLEDLNGYRPSVSVANSGAGFAANRVRAIALRRVRYYLASGEGLQDETLRLVELNE